MAAPFSINRMITLAVFIFVIMAVSSPMIQQAFFPAGGSNVTIPLCTVNGTQNNQYNNTECTLYELYGVNASGVVYNTTTHKMQYSKYGYIFNLTANVTLSASSNSSSSSAGGFFAPILQFTGLSFVFGAIGDVILIMQQLGAVTGLLFQTLFGFLPNVVAISIASVIKLIGAFIYLRVIMIGVSAWMKFDLLNA
jgi:hypothetical protein